MSTPIEQIEIRITYLEQANADLSDVVYRQRRELEALRAQLLELLGRLDSSQSQTPYSPDDEKPPHY
ncbi:MAG: SlyX family protein [Pseudomonadota bacterium]